MPGERKWRRNKSEDLRRIETEKDVSPEEANDIKGGAFNSAGSVTIPSPKVNKQETSKLNQPLDFEAR